MFIQLDGTFRHPGFENFCKSNQPDFLVELSWLFGRTPVFTFKYSIIVIAALRFLGGV